jgi:hypothetical protein
MLTALALRILVSVCPVSALSGDVSACESYETTDDVSVGVFYSEICEETRGVVRCEREDYMVTTTIVGDSDPLAGLDDCGTM